MALIFEQTHKLKTLLIQASTITVLGVIRNLSENNIEQTSFQMFLELNSNCTGDLNMVWKPHFSNQILKVQYQKMNQIKLQY